VLRIFDFSFLAVVSFVYMVLFFPYFPGVINNIPPFHSMKRKFILFDWRAFNGKQSKYLL